MKSFIHIFVYSIVMIICFNLAVLVFLKNREYFYVGVNDGLIDKDVSELDDIIGLKFRENFNAKRMLVYPSKFNHALDSTGYSLTIYYDENDKVHTISNEIFYMGGNTKLFSKQKIISKEYSLERIIIWPFINFDLR